jgi:hypothetical protein
MTSDDDEAAAEMTGLVKKGRGWGTQGYSKPVRGYEPHATRRGERAHSSLRRQQTDAS